MIETTFPAIADSELTTEEITTASRHLAVTRGFLVESVSGLSAAQWNFKPNNHAWSIAEVMEHLVIFEGRVHAIIGNMSNAPESAWGGKQIEMDRFVLNEVAKRTIKVGAPIPVRPTHRWSGPEALQLFIASREQTIQLLAAPCFADGLCHIPSSAHGMAINGCWLSHRIPRGTPSKSAK